MIIHLKSFDWVIIGLLLWLYQENGDCFYNCHIKNVITIVLWGYRYYSVNGFYVKIYGMRFPSRDRIAQEANFCEHLHIKGLSGLLLLCI